MNTDPDVAHDQALQVAVVSLADVDDDARIAAAGALGKLGGDQAAAALAGALQEECDTMQGNAPFMIACIDALACLRDADTIPVLGMAMTDFDESVRIAAARAIIGFGEDQTRKEVEGIIRQMQWATPGARRAMTEQLGYFQEDDKLAEETLVGLLKDEDPEVCRRAAAVLAAHETRTQAKPPAPEALVLICAGCRQSYRIGEDSVAVSMEFGMRLAAGAPVFSIGAGVVEREDLVAKVEDQPQGSIRAALDRAQPSWDLIRASLDRGESRTWRCKDCDSVNSYSQGKGGNLPSAKSGPSSPAQPPAPAPAEPKRLEPETTSILGAAQKGNLQDINHWISRDPKCVQSRENDYLAATPLHLATMHGHTEIVEVLLSNGADANAKDGNGWTAMHFAAEKGFKDIVAALLAHGGANIANKQCSTPAEYATRAGFKDVALLITSAPEAKPKESVHAVVKAGDLKTLEKMIAEDSELVSARDEDRKTPLHYAEIGSIADFLLSKGADPRAQDKRGCTPLHIAAMNGHKGVVSALLSKGSDANALGEGGWTPLKFAIYMDREDVAELLRQHGAR